MEFVNSQISITSRFYENPKFMLGSGKWKIYLGMNSGRFVNHHETKKNQTKHDKSPKKREKVN